MTHDMLSLLLICFKKAAKQHNTVACIEGARLAFSARELSKKSRLFHSSNSTITTTGADNLRSQLVGSAR